MPCKEHSYDFELRAKCVHFNVEIHTKTCEASNLKVGKYQLEFTQRTRDGVTSVETIQTAIGPINGTQAESYNTRVSYVA